MKAVLIVFYVFVANPNLALMEKIEFETRIVCEIEEGRRNKELTKRLYTNGPFDFNGLEVIFIKAECVDMDSGVTGKLMIVNDTVIIGTRVRFATPPPGV